MHCAMLNGIGRASGVRTALSRATPAMLPCIGFAQASAGDSGQRSPHETLAAQRGHPGA